RRTWRKPLGYDPWRSAPSRRPRVFFISCPFSMPSHSASLARPEASAALPDQGHAASDFVVRIVGAAAFAHLLNDLIQAVLPAVYPMLKMQYSLSFTQIGLIALVYQVT